MPVNFGPPECVVITDLSPVAAGGIVTFHPYSKAVWLKECDRLCDSLIPLVRESSPAVFTIGAPVVTHRGLRRIPCILLSGLSSPSARGENSDSNVPYNYTHILQKFPILQLCRA